MSLGDLLKDEINNSNFKFGTVLCIFIDQLTPPKEKYAIVIGQNGTSVGVIFFNSHPNFFVNNTQELQDCLFLIQKHEYRFLKHDSCIDCNSLLWLDSKKIQKTLDQNINRYLGKVKEEHGEVIMTMMRKSVKISKKDLKLLGLL